MAVVMRSRCGAERKQKWKEGGSREPKVDGDHFKAIYMLIAIGLMV